MSTFKSSAGMDESLFRKTGLAEVFDHCWMEWSGHHWRQCAVQLQGQLKQVFLLRSWKNVIQFKTVRCNRQTHSPMPNYTLGVIWYT